MLVRWIVVTFFVSLVGTGVVRAGEFIDVTLPGGPRVSVFVHLPERQIDPDKVVLVLPPGRQNKQAVELGLAHWLEKFVANDWLVISPTGPRGRPYLGPNVHRVPWVIDATASQLKIPLDRLAVLGISNGGVGALEFAARYPDRVRSVTVAPGMLSSTDRLAALAKIPVTLIVGEKDELWRYGSRQLADQLAGVESNRVRLVELPGIGHDAFTQISFDDLVTYLTRGFADQ